MPPAKHTKRPVESDAEASFSDGDSDDSDGAPPDLSDGDDDDHAGSGRKKPTVAERLKRIKTSHPSDRSRSLNWVLERVAEAETEINAATDATLAQPAALCCTAGCP